MGTEQVLRRARRDIEQGDLGMARLRLESSLWSGGAEVRALLVDVCHRQGDPAAAGRFGFVTDLVDDRDLAAFARRHGDRPGLMMRAIGSYDTTIPPTAQRRLADLQRRWREEPPIDGIQPPTYMDVLDHSGAAEGVLVVIAAILVIAVVTAFALGIWKAAELLGLS